MDGPVDLTGEDKLRILRATTRAPLWLCRLAMEDCGGDSHQALVRIHQIRNEEKLEHLEPTAGIVRARACLSRFQALEEQAAASGRAAAEDDIARGDPCMLTLGLLIRNCAICPSCMFLVPLVAWACNDCGARMIRLRSAGCEVSTEMGAYVNAFNATMENHIRATSNPDFRWVDVKSRGQDDGGND